MFFFSFLSFSGYISIVFFFLRLHKEWLLYEEEARQQQAKIDSMREKDPEDYNIKKQVIPFNQFSLILSVERVFIFPSEIKSFAYIPYYTHIYVFIGLV